MSLKQKLYIIIFEADTKAGKAFDLALILAVFISVLTVMLETVESLQIQYETIFNWVEYFFTFIFTLELICRLYCVKKKMRYIFSFFGLVDFISVLPFYLTIFFPMGQNFIIIRALRMLRIFRILKLKNYTNAGKQLSSALNASMPKIVVFVGFVVTLVTIIGAIMYMVESQESGFTSIPKSVYWAIVTMTTVGYGDITPQTIVGQILSSILMIIGYGIIAVPTGLVSVELSRSKKKGRKFCPHCNNRIDLDNN
jgi:voltage-gated potassium channel